MPSPRERNAVLAAAEAVVGLRLRLPLVAVSLDERGARFDFAEAAPSELSWRKAVAASAGTAASRVICDRVDRQSRRDLRKVRSFALEVDDLVLAGAALEEAESRVRANLPHIFKLGDALLEAGRLSGDDVARILAEPVGPTGYSEALRRADAGRQQEAERRAQLRQRDVDYWSSHAAHVH